MKLNEEEQGTIIQELVQQKMQIEKLKKRHNETVKSSIEKLSQKDVLIENLQAKLN